MNQVIRKWRAIGVLIAAMMLFPPLVEAQTQPAQAVSP